MRSSASFLLVNRRVPDVRVNIRVTSVGGNQVLQRPQDDGRVDSDEGVIFEVALGVKALAILIFIIFNTIYTYYDPITSIVRAGIGFA